MIDKSSVHESAKYILCNLIIESVVGFMNNSKKNITQNYINALPFFGQY